MVSNIVKPELNRLIKSVKRISVYNTCIGIFLSRDPCYYVPSTRTARKGGKCIVFFFYGLDLSQLAAEMRFRLVIHLQRLWELKLPDAIGYTDADLDMHVGFSCGKITTILGRDIAPFVYYEIWRELLSWLDDIVGWSRNLTA